MKTLAQALALLLAFCTAGRAQIYQFSEPITGSLTMSVQDMANPSNSDSFGTLSTNFSGVIYLNFNTLTETVYVDPVSNTLRQVGTISYTPSAPSIQFQENQNGIIGNVTVNLSPSGSNVLSFDTGVAGLSYDPYQPAGPSLFYYQPLWVSGLPVNGSYSLVTGGQTYNGSFSYTLNWSDNPFAQDDPGDWTFGSLALTNYPGSIQLEDFNLTTWENSPAFLSPGFVARVTASNGFVMELSPGINTTVINVYQRISGWVEDIGFGVPDVTATNIGGTAAPTIEIVSQPQSLLVHAGDTATLNVTVSGEPPLNYQWTLNGSNFPGGTSSTIYDSLTISNVTQADVGTYAVVVSGLGSATSSNAVLSMYPYLASPFPGAIIYWGQSATLSVGRVGGLARSSINGIKTAFPFRTPQMRT